MLFWVKAVRFGTRAGGLGSEVWVTAYGLGIRV